MKIQEIKTNQLAWEYVLIYLVWNDNFPVFLFFFWGKKKVLLLKIKLVKSEIVIN